MWPYFFKSSLHSYSDVIHNCLSSKILKAYQYIVFMNIFLLFDCLGITWFVFSEHKTGTEDSPAFLNFIKLDRKSKQIIQKYVLRKLSKWIY